MNKGVFLFGIFVFVVLVGFLYNMSEESLGSKSTGRSISKGNVDFLSYMNNQEMIKNMPDDSKISLVMGNKSYKMNDGKIVEGVEEKPEIIVHIGEEYKGEIMKNFCGGLQKARKEGNLWWESNVSSIKLAWKYRKMLEYKSCLTG